MKKEIKNFEKIMEVSLIILTVISLIMSYFEYTYAIYNMTYDATTLNNFVSSDWFYVVLLIDNIAIYIFSIFYIVAVVEKKENMLLKISLCIFSICTTMISSTFIINGIATMFGIF